MHKEKKRSARPQRWYLYSGRRHYADPWLNWVLIRFTRTPDGHRRGASQPGGGEREQLHSLGGWSSRVTGYLQRDLSLWKKKNLGYIFLLSSSSFFSEVFSLISLFLFSFFCALAVTNSMFLSFSSCLCLLSLPVCLPVCRFVCLWYFTSCNKLQSTWCAAQSIGCNCL